MINGEDIEHFKKEMTYHMQGNRWFVEIVQDFDGTYYANMAIEGEPVEGFPHNVSYNELKNAIKNKTGICILNRKDMIFTQLQRKKYAYIDATQYRGEGKDCRVTLDEIISGWMPDFS